MSTDRKLQIAPALVQFWLSFSNWGQNQTDLIRWNNSFLGENNFVLKSFLANFIVIVIIRALSPTPNRYYVICVRSQIAINEK